LMAMMSFGIVTHWIEGSRILSVKECSFVLGLTVLPNGGSMVDSPAGPNGHCLIGYTYCAAFEDGLGRPAEYAE